MEKRRQELVRINMKYQVRNNRYDSQHDSQTPRFSNIRKAADLVPGLGHKKHPSVLDPPFDDYAFQSNRRVGNRKNVESEAMSRALGFVGSNRYQGANDIIRESRLLVNNREIPEAVHRYQPLSQRGPCPDNL